VSPVHIEYLGNMGVHASLSISIIVGGELWGLIACHHLAARLPSFVARTAAELFGSMYSMMLESRLRQDEAVEEQRSRELADRLITAIAGNDKLVADPQWLQDMTRDMIDSDGVAIYSNGDVFSNGMVPPTADVAALARQLNTASPSKVFVTDHLGELYAPAEGFTSRAAGMLSIPISRMPRDYIMLFRCERMQMINWGGDPAKMVESTADGARLSPRKSFAAFADVVRGRSEPFSGRDQRIGEAVRQAMIEVILRLTEVNSEDRRRAAERQELLIAELNHRVRNILALIRGLVIQTGSQATDISGYVASLSGRVQALARAHDLVTRQSWGPSDIRSLFDDEIAAHAKSAGHVTIIGPPVLLHPQAVSTLALVVHEMMTNSVKYGALSSGGKIEVTIEPTVGNGVSIRWRERGGPAVQAPKRRGFGSVIVERTVPFDLEGTAEVRYVLAGLEADFFIPEQYVFVAESPQPPAGDASAVPVAAAGALEPADAPAPLAGLDVLLVEDSMIIAIDAEYMLRDLGAATVVIASTIAAAEAVADKQRFDFAMLDVNVGTRTSFDFAARLGRDSVPYIFASGYGDQVPLSATQPSIVVVQKPYELAHIAAAVMQTLGQGRTGNDARVNIQDPG
jgi:light-regulated signal transduction histidine kinase (bacteriophytochrome)